MLVILMIFFHFFVLGRRICVSDTVCLPYQSTEFYIRFMIDFIGFTIVKEEIDREYQSVGIICFACTIVVFENVYNISFRYIIDDRCWCIGTLVNVPIDS